MGFWQYFRDTLAWPLIRRVGLLAALAEGGAGALDDVRDSEVWLRKQFHPGLAEAEHVATFARARGITRHRLETDDQFRSRVVRAYAWQLLGGKQAGLPQILEHYGYAVERIVNLRDEDPERWADFRVELEAERLQADDYELLGWILNDQKPARSKLADIRLAAATVDAEPMAVGTAQIGTVFSGGWVLDVDVDPATPQAAGVGQIVALFEGAMPDLALAYDPQPCTAGGVAVVYETIGA
ncbi:MAG: phage tail protein [Desulfovibrionaceae bacterium]